MPAPTFTAEDFGRAIVRLMPTGEVWPKYEGTTVLRTAEALGGTPARQTDDAAALLVDLFPGTAVSLLAEWEATVGLPNACTPLGSTVADRQLQVLAKLADTGGASKADFLRIMVTFGYFDAWIETFAPFRAEIDTAEWPVYSDDWAFTWWMHATSLGPVIDASVACEIASIAPAHTIFYAMFVGGVGFGYYFNNNFGG